MPVLNKAPLFTPEELAEIRRADREIDRAESKKRRPAIRKPGKEITAEEKEAKYLRRKKYREEHAEQIRETNRRYRHTHREHERERDRAYRKANADKVRQWRKATYANKLRRDLEGVRAKRKAYYLAHKEESMEYQKRWRSENKAKTAQYNRDYRQRRKERENAQGCETV